MTGTEMRRRVNVSAATGAVMPLIIMGPELQATTPSTQAARAQSWVFP